MGFFCYFRTLFTTVLDFLRFGIGIFSSDWYRNQIISCIFCHPKLISQINIRMGCSKWIWCSYINTQVNYIKRESTLHSIYIVIHFWPSCSMCS